MFSIDRISISSTSPSVLLRNLRRSSKSRSSSRQHNFELSPAPSFISDTSTGAQSPENAHSAGTVSTINSIMSRQPSMINMEVERQRFGSGLDVMEPRPIVYWGSMEERMSSSIGSRLG
ncbi:BgTH12-07038 [Blumeria graminis f. sp. triticale]|uniref:BgTH12-07038 n=1 Tax=Blumeria graminis f. sp. triticale TaxID=1689686 RepID=A0A9W4GIP2_BLUGR|nr:BgTH12-07038 [Blumeria graminis f. sp. triticale]